MYMILTFFQDNFNIYILGKKTYILLVSFDIKLFNLHLLKKFLPFMKITLKILTYRCYYLLTTMKYWILLIYGNIENQ